MATILLLNGAGSSGKSSIAHALQSIVREPFLHVRMDAFLEMLPEALQDGPPGFSYQTGEVNGGPIVSIEAGPAGEALLRGMRRAIAAMAAQGNNLIVDDVLCNGGMPQYRELLIGFDFHSVGVFAPLDILEQRERERGDRLIGLARWQFDRVHSDIDYDLTVDTGVASPLDCAQAIKHRFDL